MCVLEKTENWSFPNVYVHGQYSRAPRHYTELKESVKALIGDGMRGIRIRKEMVDTAHYARDALKVLSCSDSCLI